MKPADALFLSLIADGVPVRQAEDVAGVCRATLYRRARVDAEFAAQWQAARESAVERLGELRAMRRPGVHSLAARLEHHLPARYGQSPRYAARCEALADDPAALACYRIKALRRALRPTRKERL